MAPFCHSFVSNIAFSLRFQATSTPPVVFLREKEIFYGGSLDKEGDPLSRAWFFIRIEPESTNPCDGVVGVISSKFAHRALLIITCIFIKLTYCVINHNFLFLYIYTY